ncbi:Uma2 family endonuclease [Bacillaceae bacterium]
MNVMPHKDHERKFNYLDYLSWEEENARVELIDGKVYNMTPSPSTKYQVVLGELFRRFADYLEQKSCQVFISPFDVRLFAENKKEEEIVDVVQPDLLVVCDEKKVDERGCKGSPDLIVEVFSPASAKKDRLIKYRLYEKAKVKEYWIVDPLNESVEVYTLEQGRYVSRDVCGKEDEVSSVLFADFGLSLRDF